MESPQLRSPIQFVWLRLLPHTHAFDWLRPPRRRCVCLFLLVAVVVVGVLLVTDNKVLHDTPLRSVAKKLHPCSSDPRCARLIDWPRAPNHNVYIHGRAVFLNTFQPSRDPPVE